MFITVCMVCNKYLLQNDALGKCPIYLEKNKFVQLCKLIAELKLNIFKLVHYNCGKYSGKWECDWCLAQIPVCGSLSEVFGKGSW